MARQTYHFVAGEEHMQFTSSTVLDAMLNMRIYSQKKPIPNNFKKLPIEAYDSEGNHIATRTWDDWNAAILKDTYGDNYNEILDHAAGLLR